MASGSGSTNPIQPLSIGNAVTIGLRLYRESWKQFFRIALFATLWVLLPWLVALGVAIFFVVVKDYYALLGLIIPALLVLLVYCSAKYIAGSALIARLAFKQMADEPEPEKDAARYIRSRTWRLFWNSVLVFLISMAVVIAAYIGLAILFFVGALIIGIGSGGTGASPSLAVIVPVGLVGAVILAVLIAFIIRFQIRLSGSGLPLAIEANATTTSSIGRFWNLSNRNVGRIFVVLLLTYLVTLPIQLMAWFISTAIQTAINQIIAPGIDLSSSEAIGYGEIFIISQILGFLASMILSFLLGVFMLPLWEAIRATIYYDLLNRSEGLGLQLRDRGAS
jgi:hypothetical protein